MEIGRVLAARYRIEAVLGSGAMGEVYRARHVKVGRPFAIKVLHRRMISDAKLRKRFEREAQLAGRLRHKNVAAVIDVGETDEGLYYLVMEYAEGATLTQTIDGTPIPPARAIPILQQLCDGLAHAHEHEVIHRDFKPDNIIIEAGDTPRIIDFGIAILREEAAAGHSERITSGGVVLGTPQYMPPEHAMGLALDHRVDLFALGVVSYEMLTGQLPFDGSGVEVARANMSRDTPPMGVRAPFLAVDPLLEAFTRRLMARRREDRPPTATAARALLDLVVRDRAAASRELGVSGTPRTAPTEPRPAERRPGAMRRWLARWRSPR